MGDGVAARVSSASQPGNQSTNQPIMPSSSLSLSPCLPACLCLHTGALSGSLIPFSQGEFFPAGDSTAETGYLYVPKSCASGARCRLHISFHGCEQNYGAVGDAYTSRAGYNKWADTNNILVLYVQAYTLLLSLPHPDEN